VLNLLRSLSLIFLAVIPSASAQTRHYGKLGDLVVTATGVTTTPAREDGERYVAVFVRIRYGGTDMACASFTVKLKGTDSLEYDEFRRISSDVRWPNPPRVSRMSHGQESSGAYVFEVKTGIDPAKLLLKLDSQNTGCDSGPIGGLEAAPNSDDIDLDLHDLSAPANAESDARAVYPNPGAGGNSYPLCTYCPAPSYTREATRAKIEGTVTLVVVVTADGTATNIHVMKGLGYGLDASAVETVGTWRFKPAAGPDGKPVAVRYTIEVTFRRPQ
jgi:TonB family protein